MTDPISAISAIAIALHAAKKVYNLVEGIRDSPREIQTVCNDSKCICDTLDTLKRFLEESKDEVPTEVTHSLHIPLDNTRVVLETLLVKLKPFVTSKGELKTSKLGAIRWSFYQKDVKQLGEQLSNGKSTLNMTLAVISVIKTAAIKHDTSEIIDYIRKLGLDQRPGQEKPQDSVEADEADNQWSDPRMQGINFALTRFLETASTVVDSPTQSPWASPTNAEQISIFDDGLENENGPHLVNAPALTKEDSEAEIHDILTKKSAGFLNDDGQSALHLAAMQNEYMTGDVLRRGIDIDINIRNVDGETPLMCAVKLDKEEIVALLLKNNANVNLKASDSGSTCLHIAAAKDKIGIIIQLLLERGADLEATDEMGLTPMCAAALNGNDVATQKLIEHGAKIGNALQYAVTLANHAFMARLLNPKGPDFEAFYDASSYGLPNPLGQDTVSKRRVFLVRMLLDHGADIHARNDKGFTPLQIAAVTAQGTLVDMLLEQGASAKGATVLCAYWGLNTSTVKSLLEGGADIHVTDGIWNKPALTWESEVGSLAMIEVLLQHGANVHHRDKHATALHYASGNGRTQIVQRLLTAGANPNLLTHEKRTSLHAVASRADRYFRAGRWWDPSPTDRKDTATLLLDSPTGCDIDAIDSYGRAALHYAAKNGLLGVVEVIVNQGGDWEIQDERGLTPLESAQEWGRMDVVRFLKRKKITRDKEKAEAVCVAGAET